MIGPHLALIAAIMMNSPIETLLEGNKRFVEGRLIHPNRSQESREAQVQQQRPFAIILGCSDSRVSPEIVFDQGVGDLFIVRVAGNVVGPLELESINYAAINMQACCLLVLAHSRCGAITATLEDNTADIQAVAEKIHAALPTPPPTDIDEAAKINARYVANYLRKTPVISRLIKENKIEVFPCFYDIKTGKVTLLQ